MTYKHAYLIIAHDNLEILQRLLTLVDDRRNDIYVHIDKKCKDVPFSKLKNCVKSAKVHFIQQIAVEWGGDTLIKAELLLLKEATKEQHLYYHLLSGVDLLLWTQDEVHDYFMRNNGKEFISFDSDIDKNEIEKRIGYYHILQNYIGRKHGKKVAVYYQIEKCLIYLQKLAGIKRTRKSKIEYCKGSNWFSISQKLAEYILMNEKWIKKHFFKSFCIDELFLQTLVRNSKYKNRVTNKNLRLIDWERGTPYTFTQEDYDMIISSGMMVARKFNEKKDMKIVNQIVSYVERKKYSEVLEEY